MIEKDVIQVLKAVSEFYPGRFQPDDLKGTVKAWHRVLAEYELEEIMDNLTNYVKANKFPPTVSDLLKSQAEQRDRFIPSYEETQKILKEQEEAEEAARNDPDLQAAQEENMRKIREMLGIKRGGAR
ncbi:helicase loader [Bacillus phage 000TH010]|uniref:Helicase loader n=1 Tax=Bacillus phage 000TH010 TaxID=2601652 RepID=A0A5P8PHT0_9CAUD|nr:helicase loader [Bacillus phage 000TH010]QFR56277.1 helicase loader [Bacillus phage 000TH010]